MKLIEDTKVRIMLSPNTAFFATLLLGMDVIYDDSIPTARTNGKWIKLNTAWFKSLTIKQRVFLLLHEICHTIYLHSFRLGNRDPKEWNRACDYAINAYLVYECGYAFIDGGCLDKQYHGMGAEEIYTLLPANPTQDTSGMGEDLEANEGTKEEQQANEQDVLDRIVQATQQAQMSNNAGSIPSDVLRVVMELLYPILPWETLLDRYVTEKAKEDYSWSKRNRRYTDIIMPGLYSEQMGTVSVYVDASCSVSEQEFTQYMSEIAAIKHKLNPAVLEVVSFDTEIQNIQTIHSGEKFNITLVGGGGTRLTEVAERVNDTEADVIILFTDGYYTPVHYDKEVLHIIVNNPAYINDQGMPTIHIAI